jgi:hypothetical protein
VFSRGGGCYTRTVFTENRNLPFMLISEEKKILSEVCVFALVPGSFFAVGLHEAFFLILPLCPSPPYIFFKEWGIAS